MYYIYIYMHACMYCNVCVCVHVLFLYVTSFCIFVLCFSSHCFLCFLMI